MQAIKTHHLLKQQLTYALIRDWEHPGERAVYSESHDSGNNDQDSRRAVSPSKDGSDHSSPINLSQNSFEFFPSDFSSSVENPSFHSSRNGIEGGNDDVFDDDDDGEDA